MAAMRVGSALVLAIVAMLVVLPSAASPQTKSGEPTLPVISHDACPGKGRIVPDWKIGARATLFDSWKRHSAVIGTLHPGDRVTVLAGVIVAYRPDVISVTDAMPDLSLQPGDRILRYAYYSNGESDIWAKGMWHGHYDLSSTREKNGTGCGNNCNSVVIEQGIIDSWRQVKTATKATGWALDYRQVGDKFTTDSNFAELCAD